MFSPDSTPMFELEGAPSLSRRHALSALGLAGLGIIASSASAKAVPSVFASSSPRVSVPTSSSSSSASSQQVSGGSPTYYTSALSHLPEEWAVKNGAAAAAYLTYLNSLKLQRISPVQVVETHAKQKCSVWNAIPPKPWWPRMGYVLRVVDRIAKEMNASPVEIISAYRAPGYNAHCAGAKAGSWHQANVAADVKFPQSPSKVTAMARELRSLGLFRGGVGGYWNFTHIDARGENMDW